MYNDRKSGSQIINVKAKLELTDDAQIEFGNSFEISLDCFLCVAARRTIKIGDYEEYGICIKTRHQFPIKIISKIVNTENNIAKVCYKIEYWYSPFFDTKYNQESKCLPTWGRISFKLTCPKCLVSKESSLQNNTIRPWTNYCECGNRLYTEKEIFPIFEKVDES